MPDEDQGTIMVNVTTSPGTSLEETYKVLEQVANRIADIPQVENAMETAGFNMIASAPGSSYAMGIVKLKNWDERPNPEDEVHAVIGHLRPHGRHQECPDFRRGTPYDFGLRYDVRFLDVSAGPRRR